MRNQINPDLMNNNYSVLGSKVRSPGAVYMLSVVVGILSFMLAVVLLRGTVWALDKTWIFLKAYWIWLVVGLILLIFLKKILSKKQVIMTPPPEYGY